MNKYILYGIIAYIAYTFLKSKSTATATPISQAEQEKINASQIIQSLAVQPSNVIPGATVVSNTDDILDYMYISTTTVVQPNAGIVITEPINEIPISYQQYMSMYK